MIPVWRDMSVIWPSGHGNAPPPALLSVRLLGMPRIYLRGRPVEVARWPKVLAMLAYLLVEPRPHPRAALAALLWPDSLPRQAQQNLRQILYRLRRLLTGDQESSQPHIVTDRQHVWVDTADVWVDVTALEALLKRVHSHDHRRASVCITCVGHLEEAVTLHRGPFLEGLGDVGSVPFEQWLLLWQESLRHQVAQARYTLAEHHLAHGRAEQARTYVRELLSADPWDEAAERLFLRATWRLEGRNAALSAYQRFAAALASELGVPPEDETRALAEHIKRAEGGPPSPPGLLPRPLTPFFGRQQVQAQLATYLAQKEQQLITLVGIGGCGKTRLALEVARAQIPDWRDGIWFVPLAQVATAERLAKTIAEVLIPTFSDTRAVTTRLLDFLRHRELLLVLDNFEHLVPDGVGLVREILHQAPRVKMLVTSQARLNIPEEWVIPLNGLDFPPADERTPGTELEAYSAVQLFLHHARRVNPAWSPEPEDWASILHVCRQVDGLPLGIELAAAWGRSLSSQQIATEGQTDLDFFRGQPTAESPKHHNLRLVFARAYAMLSDEVQRLFRQLAVFQGGFDLTAAQEVAGATLSTLSTLLDRSLLRISATGRWGWHPLLHRFAAELLNMHPDEAHAARQRHAAYYLAFLQAQQERLWGEQIGQALAEIEGEIKNVQAAWNWAVTQGDVQALAQGLEAFSLYHYLHGFFERGEKGFDEAVRQLGPLEPEKAEGAVIALVAQLMTEQAHFLMIRARHEEAVDKARQAAALADLAHDRYVEARAWLVLGTVYQRQGTYPEAYAPLRRALTLTSYASGDAPKTIFRLQAEIHRALAGVLWKECRYSEALAHLRQAEALDRQLGDLWGAAWTHNSLGLVLENMGHCDQAIGHYQQALTLFQKAQDCWGESIALGNLGYIHSRVGMYEQASEYYRRDLRICREIGDRRGQSWTLDNLSLLACRQGRYADSHQYARQALQIAQDIQDRPLEGHIWIQIGRALAGLGRLSQAADAYRQAVTLQNELGLHPLAMEALAGLVRVALAQGDTVGALAHTEEILTYLDAHELDRTDDQIGIYLSCYRALQANCDPRATPLLERACRLLNTRVNRIGDADLRRSFLEAVGSHRDLLAESGKRGCAEEGPAAQRSKMPLKSPMAQSSTDPPPSTGSPAHPAAPTSPFPAA